ncbi:MAG: NAD(P)-dependent oxidoreductase [Rhodospirillaceae bacterium]|jgi:3-hydroxyisobutyrate dehydrogenase-like beta-hydroxyacid dehydrogenase|nr:NAD(P)-dependent oxidoreductase [Rhodospirillaceae bacterium]MBT5938397.1 NAD(P)-dependent oxidoreductase [Rhodospirillaceae bacterium]MBT7265815.1 NAD(P)-dependent oxidoreductase [Rhodospirillaceae bacterium]
MANIGFIGLGKMGHPMAMNLAKAGHTLAVYNRTRSKADDIVAAGATAPNSVAEVAKQSDTIITMVSDDAALEAMALGKDGILENAQSGSTFIDMSTVSPEMSVKIAEETAAKGLSYLRAPVNGTVMQAEASTLVVLISGPQACFEEHKNIFEIMGDKIFYIGEDEQARYMKLCINMMVGMTSFMMAEALALGEAGGLDWDRMIETIKNSAVGSPVVHYKEQTLKNRDYTAAFSAKQMAKDFDLMLEAGKASNVPLAMASLGRQNLSAMIATGRGEQDFFGYIDLLEELSGLKK